MRTQLPRWSFPLLVLACSMGARVKSVQGDATVDALFEGAVRATDYAADKAHSILGKCWVMQSAADAFPVPCRNIVFALNGGSAKSPRRFQTDEKGEFLLGSLESDRYEIELSTPGYSLAGEAKVFARPGESVVLKLRRVAKQTGGIPQR